MSVARRLLVVCLTITLVLSATPGTQVVYEVVSDFGTSDGIYVGGSLVVEPDGTIYGTTQSGGQTNQGTIFSADRFGVRTTLHTFNGTDGRYPLGGLTKGPDGYFYGTTNRGGEGDWGTIFRVSSSGSFETLNSFDPITAGSTLTGYFPSGGLTVGADGHLYGVTSEGGQFGGGVIFRVTTSGDAGVVHTFINSASPNPWLTLGPDGALYGATRVGGSPGSGTLFRFTPGSGVEQLHVFAAASGSLSAPEGRYPSGPLAVAADGSIYGTNQYGGPLGLGTLFRLTSGGVFSVLHGFSPQDPATGQYLEGLYPTQGVTVTSDGNLYAPAQGGANGAGVLLRVDAGTGVVSVAHTVDYLTTGSTVQTPLVQGADGRLYGATQSGAAGNYGALFAYDPVAGGAPSILLAFSGLIPISTPWSGLTRASDGRVYGTGRFGGNNHGGIFRLEANGTTTGLHAFSPVNGNQPESELVEGPDGALYGVTPAGGDHNVGAIFRIDANGVLTGLHSFVYESGSCPDGCQPHGTLAVGADSALYGTTLGGGQHGVGVLYRITTNGLFSVRHHFGAQGSGDGSSPYAGLIPGADGRIYGTSTQGGGPQGAGTVFVYDLVTGVSVLHRFAGSAGSGPHAPLVQGSDGMLYGTTRGAGTNEFGTVFRVDPATGAHATLHTFTNPADGAYPVAGLVQGSDGAFYGVTSYGGADPGGGAYGTVFRITAAGDFSVRHTFKTTDGGGYYARGRLLEVDRGVFYGTTAEGGPTGRGTVFRLTVPMPPENTPPGANDGSRSTLEDTPVSGLLSAGDVDGDPLVFSLVSNGSLGTAAITNATTGAFTYTPHADVSGEDTFTFRVNDGQADSNVATMTVTIVAANDAPVAYDGTLAVTAGAAAIGTLTASDVDGPTLSYSLIANGARGTAIITNAATGAFIYTANPGAGGSDTFTFKATDGALDSNVATVTVTVGAGNQAPVVLTGVVTTQESTPVSGRLQAWDPNGDALTFTITSGGTLGTVQLLDQATGAFSYTPNAGVTGYDSFTFEATDGQQTGSGTQMVFVVAVSPQRPGEITRASVTSAGAQANGISEGLPALSADGRFVAFESLAPLVAGDTNGARDVFVRDRQSGEATRASVGSAGTQANSHSFMPAVSADGRFVAFRSFASNLVPGDSNGTWDVFVHDRQTGATSRVSVASDGTQANNASEAPAMSADGRFVAFHSEASNLVAGDSNGVRDVFVHDRQTGATARVSAGSGGAGNNHSDRPKLSADGRFVVFHSLASNLVAGDSNGTHDVFVHDRHTSETTRVSVASDGTQANSAGSNPAISADGRFVAFHSAAWNLVPGDTPLAFNVFVRDRVAATTTRVSAGSGGVAGDGNSFLPALSADGRWVAFYSFATNLVAGDSNGTWDVFVVDRPGGETTRVSVGSGGAQANGVSSEAALSADGRAVAFSSTASNLVPGDTNNVSDVFVADGMAAAPPTAEDGAVSTSEDVPVNGTLVASDPRGAPLTFTLLTTGTLGGAVLTDAITGAFTYTPDPDAHGTDTFTFEVSNGRSTSNVATVTVTIAAVNDAPVATAGTLSTFEDTPAAGTMSATDVDGPALTFGVVSNGVLGSAVITNAATGAYSYTPHANAFGTDTFTFSASDGTNESSATVTVTIAPVNDAPVARTGVVTTSEGATANGLLQATDAEGDTISFSLLTQPAQGTVILTDAGTGAFTYTPGATAIGYDTFTFQVSDGNGATTATQMVFVVANSPRWPGGTVRMDETGARGEPSGGSQQSVLSADGRYVAFASPAPQYVPNDTNLSYDIFVYDRQLKQITRASVTSAGTQATSNSFNPALSADGRFVAFVSYARLAASDVNDLPDIYVHDRVTGETTRVSVGSDGSPPAVGSNQNPAISADGRYVAFASTASTFDPLDTNGALDVFIRDRTTGQTIRVSTGTDAAASDRPSISADGRYVAFESSSRTLVPGDTNNVADVFVYDRVTGSVIAASRNASGQLANGPSSQAAMSADGRYVAFASTAANLVQGVSGPQIYIRNLVTGAITAVASSVDGTGFHALFAPRLSADGRTVVFSTLRAMTPGDTNGHQDVFARHLDSGQTFRISVAGNGAEAQSYSQLPAISADARFIAFESHAANLAPDDTNDSTDIFVVGGVRLAPTAASHGSSAEAGSIDVDFVYSDTSWTASSGAPWLTITNQSATSGNGTVTYAVAANTGAARTGTLTIAAQTVTISQAVSIIPIAQDTSVSTAEDTVLSAVLSATDPNGDPLTFSIVTNGSLGTGVLTNASTGAFTYTPHPNVSGTDSFTFRVNDGTTDSNVATVAVSITAVNDAPVALNGTLTTAEDTAASGALLATDIDSASLTFVIVTNGTVGTATITNAATGAFSYTPNLNANGTDTFTFRASDGMASSEGTITVTITPVVDISLSNNSVDFGGQTVNTTSDAPAFNLGAGIQQGFGAGDLDGDGDVDLVVANTSQGTLTVGVNNGAGQFVPGVTVAVGSWPNGLIVVQDFDGDGDRDVAVANQSSGTVSVLLNNGAGGLNPTVNYPNYPGAFSLAAGDLNADGRIDLVVASSSPRPALLGNGDGSFSPGLNNLALSDSGPTVADVNGDGRLDVTNGQLVYLGQGGGTFGSPISTGLSTLWSAVGDFDGDGRPDLLGADRGSADLPVQVARGLGDGAFQAAVRFPHDRFAWAVAAGDLNGDTLADAVATTDVAGTISVYLGDPSTSLSRQVRYGNYSVPAPPVIADLTGDGIVDIALASPVRLLKGKGDGTFLSSQLAIVSNNSGANASVGPVTLQGPDASNFVASLTCQSPLQPGGPCRIQVEFFPRTAGAKSATLEIMTSDGPMYVALSGNGTFPPPMAVTDTYSVAEDSTLEVAAPGVRANDLNASGASASVVDGPSNGSLTLNADGSFVYTPASNFTGSDSFTYRLSNAGGDSSLAAVSLTVTAVNDAPIAADHSLTTSEDSPVSGVLTANDIDSATLTFAIVANGTKGVAVVNDPTTGAFTYTPDANATGTDAFMFRVSDGALDSNAATVTITIDSVNDAPVAANGTLSATEDIPVSGTLTAQEPDGDPLTYTIVANGTKGRVVITNLGTGTFVYTPLRNASGADVFTFSASDGSLQSNLATVAVTIGAVNDVPRAHGQSLFVLEDTPRSIQLAGSDADGSELTFTVLSHPTHGTLSGTPPNLVYTPNPNYNGVDAFSFRVSDGSNESPIAIVNLDVTATSWTPLGPSGGAVTALVVDPHISSVLYAGTFGGMFRSTDGGNSWQASSRGLTNSSITCIAVDPVTPTTLFVGTSGGGLFRSMDGGASWTASSAGLGSSFVASVAIDPVTSTTLYASSGNQVFKSTNGGASWSATGSGPLPAVAVAISIDASTPTTLYAATQGGGVIKSMDSGASWTTVNTGLTNLTIQSLAIDPTASTTLFAATNGGVFKTTNGGANWFATGNSTVRAVTIVIDPLAPDTLYVGHEVGLLKTTNGGTDWFATHPTASRFGAIAIDPSDTSTLFAGTYSGVYRSTTGGASWTTHNSGLSNVFVSAVANNPLAPDTLYAGGSGIFRSLDGGLTWTQNLSMPQYVVFALVVDPMTPTTLYAGTNGGVLRTTDGGTSWVRTSLSNGFGLSLAVDPHVQGTVYVGTAQGVFKSTDGGISWGPANGGLPNLSIRSLAIDPVTSTTVYAGTDVGVFKSTDAAVTWLPCNNGLSGSVTALVIHPETPDVLYAGGGFVYKSNDGGASWSRVLFTNYTVRGLALDPARPDVVYAATQGIGVFRSSDAGTTWRAITSGLTTLAATSILVAPGEEATPYVGTEAGVFRMSRAVNDAPTAADQSISTMEGVARNIALTASDPDAEPLTFTIVTPPSHGTLSGTAPNLTYTPYPNYNGPDSFTFMASDSVDYSNIATVSITVTAVNVAPVASNGTLTTHEDVAVPGILAAADGDGDALTFSIVSNGTWGSAVITNAATGAFTYTPNANATGTDTFTFRVNDGAVDSNVATVTVTINAVNDAPVVSSGTLSATEDIAASGTLVGADADGDRLTYSIVANGTLGNAVITNAATGAFTYTPNANANGIDTVIFRVSDGIVASNIATITVTIAPVNDAPVAQNGSATTFSGASVSGTLAATDIDSASLVYSIVTGPAMGTVVVTNAATGTYTYTAAAGASGTDTFTFRASDGELDSNLATVTISISGNRPPTANAGSLTTQEDRSANGTLSASDPDGNRLTFSIVSGPSRGTATITNATIGRFTYVPQANANGTDAFTFRVSDGTNDSNVTTVTVTITPVNDAPLAGDASFTIARNTTLDATLVGSDVDGDSLTYAIARAPRRGTISNFNPATGTFTYTPANGFTGSESFTFRVSDGTTTSAAATVTIRVN